MQGRLIFINQAARTGLIFGADRNRYRFELDEWQGGSLPRRNSMVEFEPAGNTALGVHLADALAAALEQPPVGVAANSKPPRPPKGRKPAPTDSASAVLPGDQLLSAIDAVPPSNLSAAPASRLLLTDEPVSRRSPLKPILIGIFLAVLLFLCCYAYVHLKKG
jgi:hypothetical protein